MSSAVVLLEHRSEVRARRRPSGARLAPAPASAGRVAHRPRVVAVFVGAGTRASAGDPRPRRAFEAALA